MKYIHYASAAFIVWFLTSCKDGNVETEQSTVVKTETEVKIDSLLSIMTLDEKVGQLNLMNGFWDITGPVPQDDKTQEKYNQLKQGFENLFLQPCYIDTETIEANGKSFQITEDVVKQNPEWRLSLQTHKWMGIL